MSTNRTELADENPSAASDRTFDWNRVDEPALAVVTAVAAATGRDPMELEPLSSRVDPDALGTLFDTEGAEAGQRGHVQFEYENCWVGLEAGGRISVVPIDG